jgi:hypothetical protein
MLEFTRLKLQELGIPLGSIKLLRAKSIEDITIVR